MTISTNPHLRHPHPRPSPRGGYPCPGCPGLSHEEGRRALDATTPGEGRSPPPSLDPPEEGAGSGLPSSGRLSRCMPTSVRDGSGGRERGPRGRESGGREGVPVTKRERDRAWCVLIYFLRFLSSDCVLNRQRKLVWFSLSFQDTTWPWKRLSLPTPLGQSENNFHRSIHYKPAVIMFVDQQLAHCLHLHTLLTLLRIAIDIYTERSSNNTWVGTILIRIIYRYGDGFSWRRINYNLDLHESGKNPSKCKM